MQTFTTEEIRSFTMVGGYPLFYLTREDSVLCPECAKQEENKQFLAAVNWESPDLYCDECSGRIESAYAEDCED